jgi:hypothetical protein
MTGFSEEDPAEKGNESSTDDDFRKFLTVLSNTGVNVSNGVDAGAELGILASAPMNLRARWHSAIQDTFRAVRIRRVIAIVPMAAALSLLGTVIFLAFGWVVWLVIVIFVFAVCLYFGHFPTKVLRGDPVILIARVRWAAGYKVKHYGGTTNSSIFKWLTDGFAARVEVDEIARAILLKNGSFAAFGEPEEGFGSALDEPDRAGRELPVRPRLVKNLRSGEMCVLVCTTKGAVIDRVKNLRRPLTDVI